jgi:hypothetical protein
VAEKGHDATVANVYGWRGSAPRAGNERYGCKEPENSLSALLVGHFWGQRGSLSMSRRDSASSSATSVLRRFEFSNQGL